MGHQEGEVKWLWVAWSVQFAINIFGLLGIGIMVFLAYQNAQGAKDWHSIDAVNFKSRLQALETQQGTDNERDRPTENDE